MMSTYVDCRPNSECGLQLCSKVDTYLIKRACNDSSETLLFFTMLCRSVRHRPILANTFKDDFMNVILLTADILLVSQIATG